MVNGAIRFKLKDEGLKCTHVHQEMMVITVQYVIRISNHLLIGRVKPYSTATHPGHYGTGSIAEMAEHGHFCIRLVCGCRIENGGYGIGDIMKTIPLSEPMGGDCSCCVHGDQCRDFVDSIDNVDITFRCPLTIEVENDINYADHWHESCFDNKIRKEQLI